MGVRQNTRAINSATTTTTAADVAGTVVTAVVTMAIIGNLITASNANVWTLRSRHPIVLLQNTRLTASATITTTPRNAAGMAVTAANTKAKKAKKTNSDIANSASVLKKKKNTEPITYPTRYGI